MASVLMSDAPYASWLSDVLATLEEHKIDRIAVAAPLPNGDYFLVEKGQVMPAELFQQVLMEKDVRKPLLFLLIICNSFNTYSIPS